MTDIVNRIAGIFRQANLPPREAKTVLRMVVRHLWPGLPFWSPSDAPFIEEARKASVGSGVALVFEEDGVRKVVLAEAGEHYRKPGDDAGALRYMILGGFINLDRKEGSKFVPSLDEAENLDEGAAREGEEEFRKADGAPVLEIDPVRLRLMDAKTLTFDNGEPHVAIGYMMELTADEVVAVRRHVDRLDSDPAYKAASARWTVNKHSGLPEVGGARIFALEDAVAGRCNLLHQDQTSLFRAIAAHFNARAEAISIPQHIPPAQSPAFLSPLPS